MLDDVSLNQQIKAIAQTLCTVIFNELIIKRDAGKLSDKDWEERKLIPLPRKVTVFSNWASECRANYLKLVDMGLACCEEYEYRFNEIEIKGLDYYIVFSADGPSKKVRYKTHKLQSVIEWARDNVPALDHDDCQCKERSEITTTFPLVMREKYIIYKGKTQFPGTYTDEPLIIKSYRNYYKSKLPADAKYTRRNKPEWI